MYTYSGLSPTITKMNTISDDAICKPASTTGSAEIWNKIIQFILISSSWKTKSNTFTLEKTNCFLLCVCSISATDLKEGSGDTPLKLLRFANRSPIRHFQVPFPLCFKTSLSVQPFIWKWVWFSGKWRCKKNSFPYERLCTKTRFEKEGNGSSECPVWPQVQWKWLASHLYFFY